jgi:hypothetical protein
MVSDFSARRVGAQVLEHLERRRPAIADSEEKVVAEARRALEPVRRAYAELQLPAEYMDALEDEVVATLAPRWRAAADPFTRLEAAGFSLWRGGDPIARMTYVLVGLLVATVLLRMPLLPLWLRWVPYALALLAWWLPDAQTRWHQRRYERELGGILALLDRAQPALDARLALAELLPPDDGGR